MRCLEHACQIRNTYPDFNPGETPGRVRLRSTRRLPDRARASRRPRSAGRAPIEDERSIGASSPA
jgi:hypothetical protein